MAVKHRKLAHPSQVREVPEGDVPRLLATGWCELRPQLSKGALEQRQIRARFKEAGMRYMGMWLTYEDADLLKASRRPGESIGELVTRLVRNNTTKLMNETDN